MADSAREMLAQWRRINAIAESAAQAEGIDPNIIKSMIRQESVFSPSAKSNKGAQGVMQLMPATAQELGVTDPNDPEQNIRAGTKYFARLMKRYNGDVPTALAAYNAGMGNVDKGRASSFPETKNYVSHISDDIKVRSGMPQADVPAAAPSVKVNLDQYAEQPNPEEPSARDLLAQWRASKAAPPSAAVVPNPTTPRQPEGFFSRLKAHPLDTIADELPTVGGAIGGFVGGVPGAAIGGAAGEGFTDLYNHAKELPGAIKDVVGNLFDPADRCDTLKGAGQGALEGVKKAGVDAALQGATEGAGQLVGAVGKSVGKGLIKRAFKPSADMLSKTPGLLEKIAGEGINPTGRGIETMETRTNAARAFADKLVDDAGQVKTLPNGVRIRPKNIPVAEVTAALSNHPYGGQSVVDMIQGRAARTPLYDRLTDYLTTVANDNPVGFSYNRMLKIRRGEGAAAHDIFEGIAGGQPALTKEVAAGMEAGSRKALERRVPGFADANDVTQQKLRVLEAVREAVKKREGNMSSVVGSKLRHMAPGAMIGAATANPLAALAGWAATEALTNPSVEATLGRAALKGSKVAAKAVPTALRAGEVSSQESTKTRAAKKLNKAKVDALYERYKQGF